MTKNVVRSFQVRDLVRFRATNQCFFYSNRNLRVGEVGPFQIIFTWQILLPHTSSGYIHHMTQEYRKMIEIFYPAQMDERHLMSWLKVHVCLE
jgi:hypothetical protein